MNKNWLESIQLKKWNHAGVHSWGTWAMKTFTRCMTSFWNCSIPAPPTYGVDSMGIDGSFRKDGLLVRMSSERALRPVLLCL